MKIKQVIESRDSCPVCGQTPCNCTNITEGLRDPADNPCWKGYHPVGTKKKNGRTVPNCVPNANEGVAEGSDPKKDVEAIRAAIARMEREIADPNPHIDRENLRQRIAWEKRRLNLYRDVEGVAEGELATYLVSVMDSATGEHWRIEVKVTSPEMAKERAEAMGYKVLGVKEKQGVAEGEKVGHMDADRFDDAVARLKKLAGAGPLKTVWDPQKRVYKNVPVAQQPGDKK